MTKIKLCGLSRPCDIEHVNSLEVDYIGFVFAKKSKRYVTPEQAMELKKLLATHIKAVGVFVDEPIENITNLLKTGVIDLAQLHGHESNEDIQMLREMTGSTIIQAFRIAEEADVKRANESAADFVLLDAGAGDGHTFDWSLVKSCKRAFFLAGGLHVENVAAAIECLHPFAVDVSSGIESDGLKDFDKMTAFVAACRK